MNAVSTTPSYGAYTPSFEIPIKGMTKANKDAVQAADKIAEGQVTPESMVNMMGAQYNFEANAKVLKTMDEMVGSMLDTVA